VRAFSQCGKDHLTAYDPNDYIVRRGRYWIASARPVPSKAEGCAVSIRSLPARPVLSLPKEPALSLAKEPALSLAKGPHSPSPCLLVSLSPCLPVSLSPCLLVPLSASSTVIAGRIEGLERASNVLPEPGGPVISTLCPPAAATSSARLTCSCPLISAKSAAYGGAASEAASTSGV
jgi:hypothetical protein